MSLQKMHFPAEKCAFLQKNAVSCRKMPFPAEKCGFHGAHGRKLQETQEGPRAQESRTLANFHASKNGSWPDQTDVSRTNGKMFQFEMQMLACWQGKQSASELWPYHPGKSLCKYASVLHCMPNMTGQPGYRTMEMNGGSSAPHLACAPCFPLFCFLFSRGGNRRVFRLPGAGGDHFHCTVEPSPGHVRC